MTVGTQTIIIQNCQLKRKQNIDTTRNDIKAFKFKLNLNKKKKKKKCDCHLFRRETPVN